MKNKTIATLVIRINMITLEKQITTSKRIELDIGKKCR